MKRVVLALCCMFILAFYAVAASLPDQVGKRVTGLEHAFSVSFIHAGQHSVTGMARVVSSINTNPVDSISVAYFKYRWRYLTDVDRNPWGSEKWITIPMIKVGRDLLVTTREIDVPDFECDIEFYFIGTAKVPFYQYVDYSGLGVGCGTYTEEVLGIEGHLSIGASEVLGNCGREWFVRVRCGESDVKDVLIRQ